MIKTGLEQTIDRMKMAHKKWGEDLTATIRKNKGSPAYIWRYRKQLLTLLIIVIRGQRIVTREWTEAHPS